MPLASEAQIQTDYNTWKSAFAALQTAVDAAAAALLACEQAREALDADGAPFTAWLAQAPALTSQGYQAFGASNPVVIYARRPGAPRDLAIANSIGAITSSPGWQSLPLPITP